MQYLNILYVIIITAIGYKYLRSDGGVVKGAFSKEVKLWYSGVELFWLLLFSTGVLAFSLDVGLDLMAIRLLILEILCVIGLSTIKRNPVWSLPMKIYIVYLIWLAVGVFYSPSASYAIRVILKYIYPFLVCLLGSAVVEDAEVFMKSSLFARVIGVLSVICSFIPFFTIIFPGVLWYGTARAIYFISLMVFSLGMSFVSENKFKNIILTVLFLLPCFIWTFRTSIMGSGVALITFFFIKYRLKSLPIIFLILSIGIASVFMIPSLKSKMFFDDNVSIEDYQSGNISRDDINTNSREGMWKLLEQRLYKDHEICGCGTGAVQHEMHNNFKDYYGLDVPHSDFEQQKCDNGLIGLVLYGMIIIFIFWDCFRTYWHTKWLPLKLCAIVAGASVIGVYATFYSDNVINYSMATLTLPYGFYGMMLGLRRSHPQYLWS